VLESIGTSVLINLISSGICDLFKLKIGKIKESDININIYEVEKRFKGDIDCSKIERKRIKIQEGLYRKIDAYKVKVGEFECKNVRAFILNCSGGARIHKLDVSNAKVVILDVSSSEIDQIVARNSIILHFDGYKSKIGKLNIKGAKSV